MKHLNSNKLPSPTADLLKNASLFLDFDGTLVDIAPRPGDVRVDQRLSHLLSRLSLTLDRRVAIVSGRPASQIRALLPRQSLAIAGSHGAELVWPDGRESSNPRLAFGAEMLSQLRWFAQEHPGVLVEEKPFGLALHYRLAPCTKDLCIQLVERLASESGYPIQTGKQVVELKSTLANKSDAIVAFMREPPMQGTYPVFIGDDDTDEAGFAMAKSLGGSGILVGAPRVTAASYRVADVGAALEWLEVACGALS